MSTTFANSINSNPIYADRAEKDAAGNDISSTYATKSELPEGVPAVTSSDNNKVLKASYSEGTGSYSWQTESGGGGAQADWTESDTSDPSYIQNKPAILGLAAGSNVSITEANNTLTIAATDTTYSAGSGIDITSGTISVDTTTVAMKTDIPTVPTTDQTYNSSSTNPQSGTAVAGAIAGVSQVPSVTSSDDSKVLTASYTGGVASYSWQTAQGGGGGSSNVTTADKQINVAVNGTGLPMQLNLLNPSTNYTTLNLGHPTVSTQLITPDDGPTFYAPVLEWTFSKSAIKPPDPLDTSNWYLLPLTLDIANDLVIVPASGRSYDSNVNMVMPSVDGSLILLDSADASGTIIASYDASFYMPSNNYTNPPTDVLFVQGTYGPSKLGIGPNKEEIESVSTFKLRLVLSVRTSLDPVTWEATYISQSDAEAMASMISEHASDFTLTAVSSTATSYTSYIGSTSITGHTTTADNQWYRYDFSAAETAALVPGMYMVQVDGPSSSGNQTTYVYLFKDGFTGYNYYSYSSKSSYLSSSGARREMFLMKVEENTTAIGTKVSYGNFTMVRIA